MDIVHPHMDERSKYNKLEHYANCNSEFQKPKADAIKLRLLTKYSAKPLKDPENCLTQ